ncbi:unnamed protein product [Bursaphelenchus xylophilus]|uniref:(pine wood nematode) hypothetical protein n=1 Tax=Bursaphelenchus xylophilus TaxID=6326 RepID=A0A811KEC4_BURXY|nr:unnamed protein product [Bursaphelenchus xylophilus]CAG9091996.1 unnamed protein product [Bursaphelenchus xylophilus]
MFRPVNSKESGQAMSNNSKPDPYNLDVLSAIHLSLLIFEQFFFLNSGLMAVGFALDMANYLVLIDDNFSLSF